MTRRLLTAPLLLLAPAFASAADKTVGDSIIVCGQAFPIGAPVVTWKDPGGYDAYSTDRRFPEDAPPGAPAKVELGFGDRRTAGLPVELRKKVSEQGWDLPTLREQVDQFVIHYDVCGTSKRCFKVLHDERGLSVQFMLDLDGTIYQTMDLKEGAWHATKANGRSVGIEIANMGAVPKRETGEHFGKWYKKQGGETIITVPGGLEKSGIRDTSIALKPSRPDLVEGKVHGTLYEQYDLTPQQYDSLIRLTAGLHKLFPRITLDYPRGEDGKLLTTDLPTEAYNSYHGVLGHWHVQRNKQDPGPAFQWDKVIDGAKALDAGK